MARFLETNERIHDYVVEHSTLPDPTLPALAERTAELGAVAGMQIGADQGALLTALTRIVGARFAVEVGTFTGYSSICIARGLAEGGRLLCCDVSEEWTSVARDAWVEAGVDDRIDLVIGPAADTLAQLDETPVDLAFIDADKPSYRTYLDLLAPKLAPRGVIVVDNVLWSGSVVEADHDDENRTALREFNDHVRGRDDLDVAMLTVGDGVSLLTGRGASRDR